MQNQEAKVASSSTIIDVVDIPSAEGAIDAPLEIVNALVETVADMVDNPLAELTGDPPTVTDAPEETVANLERVVVENMPPRNDHMETILEGPSVNLNLGCFEGTCFDLMFLECLLDLILREKIEMFL